MRTGEITLGGQCYIVGGLTVGDYWKLQNSAKETTDPQEICNIQANAIALAVTSNGLDMLEGEEVLSLCTFDEFNAAFKKVIELTLPRAEGTDATPLQNGSSGT
jgi:hypothetical protein